MKTYTYRLVWPLWLFEIFLGLSHRMGGWEYWTLITVTVLAFIRIQVVRRG